MNKSIFVICLALAACQPSKKSAQESSNSTQELAQAVTDVKQTQKIKPIFITDTTRHDTDDPAIWIHPTDPAQSLILGTDKDEDGALYVFDLKGNVVENKVVRNLKRPNNVDVEYGLNLGDRQVDIAVLTERLTHKIRVFSLPDMQPLDQGGIEVFRGETEPEFRDLMGIALYKRPEDGQIFAIVGRKNGPTDSTYLWQYALNYDGKKGIEAELVRKFGAFSGQKEIEAIAVDDALGYVYYSDENVGVRKYYADPARGNQELALFATQGFADDHEGISIYPASDSTGYILVSDQQADAFRIFPREGKAQNPHQHPLLKVVYLSTHASDGSEVTALGLNDVFARGLFVAMSDDKTFHLYRWEEIAGEDLSIQQNN